MLALGKLEKAEVHLLLRLFATRHSVLGGEVPAADLEEARHRAMMLIPPLGSLKQFLEVCFFVVALATTGTLVRMVLDEQKPDMIAAVREILPRSREVLLLSLKYMAVLGVFGGALIVLASSPLTSQRVHELFLSKVFIFVLSLVAQACLGWLLLPSAIRLLRAPGSPTISMTDRKLGTVFAVATSASAVALEYLVGNAETAAVIDEQWEGVTIGVVNTIVINAPQVLLFIALTLLALQGLGPETSLASEPELSRGTRLSDWVRRAREWRSGPI